MKTDLVQVIFILNIQNCIALRIQAQGLLFVKQIYTLDYQFEFKDLFCDLV